MVSDQKCMTRSSITIIGFTVSQKINLICIQEILAIFYRQNSCKQTCMLFRLACTRGNKITTNFEQLIIIIIIIIIITTLIIKYEVMKVMIFPHLKGNVS